MTQTTVTRTTVRNLLACGAIGAPVFVIAGLIQAYTRKGFDLKVHPFSFLSLGDLGWIQITTFVLTGLMFIAGAVGMRRVLRTGPGRTAGPILYAGVGVGQIMGGVFLADPAYGFGPGAPPGQPEVLSWHSQLHGLAFAVGMLSLVAALAVFTWRYASLGQRGWAIYTAVSGLLFLALAGTGFAVGDFRIMTLGIVVGWAWLSALPLHLISEDTNQWGAGR